VYLLNSDDGPNSFARLTKLFQDMENTTNYGLITGILLSYVHFRALFMLKVDPEVFITEIGYLQEMMYLVLVCIIVQMVAQLVELGIGPNPVLATVVTIAIAGVNIGVGGITYAAVSS
jgi:hypothetical protein